MARKDKWRTGIIATENKNTKTPDWVKEPNIDLTVKKECVSLLRTYREKMNNPGISERDFHRLRRTIAVLEYAEGVASEKVAKAKRLGKL